MALLAIAVGVTSLRKPVEVAVNEIAAVPAGEAVRAENRRVYRHSVLPGGVRTTEEFAARLKADSIAAAHYRGVQPAQLKAVSLAGDRRAYVSYRRGDRIFWTSKPVRIAQGETVLVANGKETVRARCGNRISDTPQQPVASNEPPLDELDMPEVSLTGSLILPELTYPGPPVTDVRDLPLVVSNPIGPSRPGSPMVLDGGFNDTPIVGGGGGAFFSAPVSGGSGPTTGGGGLPVENPSPSDGGNPAPLSGPSDPAPANPGGGSGGDGGGTGVPPVPVPPPGTGDPDPEIPAQPPVVPPPTLVVPPVDPPPNPPVDPPIFFPEPPDPNPNPNPEPPPVLPPPGTSPPGPPPPGTDPPPPEVPEPATFGLGALALLLVLYRRRS